MKKFLFGVSFVSIILPVLNCGIALLNQSTEYLCTCIAVKAAKKQMELPQEQEAISTQCIGFQTPDIIYEEEE